MTNEKIQEPEKKNYCDEDGNCTVQFYPDELNCEFCKIGFLRGICTYRVWYNDSCLSAAALIAAREANRNTA